MMLLLHLLIWQHNNQQSVTVQSRKQSGDYIIITIAYFISVSVNY